MRFQAANPTPTTKAAISTTATACKNTKASNTPHAPLGNLIYRELPNGEKQYFQYDAENQLIRAEIKKPQGNTEIWTYAYDPFGRRLSKERKDKLAWISTAPKRTHFVWDGSRLLQEYNYKGHYTYIYTDQDSYEPLAKIFFKNKDQQLYLYYFHNNQIGVPQEITDIYGNLLWYGSYTAWGALDTENRIYPNIHQPFCLQNQYFDAETGLHYNLLRYYEPATGRFINQDPIGLEGGANLYFFAPNANGWVDPLGLNPFKVFLDWHKYFVRIIKKTKKNEDNDIKEQEYQLAKQFCDTPVSPQSSKCATLHLQMQHAKRCIELYQLWDAKWKPGRHATKIKSWENRLKSLKDLAKKECLPK